MRARRDIKCEVCFVIDATQSVKQHFTDIIDTINDLSFDLLHNYRRFKFSYSAVIYRDPIDYKEMPQREELDEDSLAILDEIISLTKRQRIEKLIERNVYDEELEQENEEISKNVDLLKYPQNMNVPIPFKSNIEELISELLKVECGGGNDDPEDWVGGLNIVLHEIEWSEDSKKCIFWFSDANAHGKRFCGYDNHNEEEVKIEPLIHEMVERKINFIGYNIIRKNQDDDGCELTLKEMRGIYQDYAKKCFKSSDDYFNHVPQFYIKEKMVSNKEVLDGFDDDWPIEPIGVIHKSPVFFNLFE